MDNHNTNHKSCHQSSSNSSSSSITTSNSGSRDQHLKNLNKASYKISKPATTILKRSTFDQSQDFNHDRDDQSQSQTQPEQHQRPVTAAGASSQVQAQPQQNQSQPQPQHQPPVYNINKNDFRDVVQKLTGSPAHDRSSSSNPAPPVHQLKPQSSRLQRFRPPPLAHVSNHPPSLLNGAVFPPHQLPPIVNPNFGAIGRFQAPLSPLPPLPTVHVAAESPVSAYMRYLHTNPAADSNPKQFSGFSPLAPTLSPRWNSLPPQQQFPPPPPPPPPPEPQGMIPPPSSSEMIPSSQAQLPVPSSPLPFGCLNSPRSSYSLPSPNLLFSPSSGQLGFSQLPLSPTVQVPSPSWRGH